MIRILVVDDDDSKVDVIKLSLNTIHVDHIDVICDVRSAINSLKTNNYDLVILDLNLPVHENGKVRPNSGVTILQTLCEDVINVPNSIIGLTSFEELYDKYRGDFKELDFNLYDFNDYEGWSKALLSKVRWLQKFNVNSD